MAEQVYDSINFPSTGNAKGEQDALINRLAQEQVGNNYIKAVDAAPESTAARYAIVTGKGLANLPEGIVNTAVYNFQNPIAALETVGIGAGTAVVLKTILPKGGTAGKVAAAAIGGYFTYMAAEPIIDAYKQAGQATTWGELDNAGRQIGGAAGAFAFNSVLAIGGYKLGSRVIDPVLASPKMAGFNAAKENFYGKLETGTAKMAETVGITRFAGDQRNPSGFGAVPPYLLEELARRNPSNPDFLRTHRLTMDMQNQRTSANPVTRFLQAEKETAPAVRETYDAKGRQVQPGERARFEGEKPTGNVEVDNAFDYTGLVREFYAKEHGRFSIDGKGMKYVSTVNYGKNYENAFWDGKQMTYGRPGAASPFKSFVLLDVCGHEITHGVTQMEAGLRYWGQAGALNESMSDVFGSLIKQYARKQGAREADWLVGEGIWKESVKGGRALRDMKNPGKAYDDPAIGKDPQPAHMDQYYKTSGDNGGVHYNSGIPNRAFVLFAEEVGGNAWQSPGQIWWAARRAAGSNPSFSQFAYHTIEQARALGHAQQIPKLQSAWESVGVKPDPKALDTHTPGGGWGNGDHDHGHGLLSRLFRRTG